MMNDETTEPEKTIQTRSLPNNADPVVDYATAASHPGLLRGNASLEIQTRQAQRLVYGRKKSETKNHIIGLVRFGMNMKQIWSSASRDDPYADWSLLQIEEALNNTRKLINNLRQETESKLATAATGIQIDIASSLEPIHVPLQFANAYGYMGAYLIADYDQLVCTILTARHVGLIERRDSTRTLHQIAQRVRHAFALSGEWKFTLVTRSDIRNENPRAQRAIEKLSSMGELPQVVFEGHQRAQIAPEINTSDSSVSEMDDVTGVLPDNHVSTETG